MPEFLYVPMYDEKHRLWLMSTNKGQRSKQVQKGSREKLLCDDCEQKFSRSERYANHVWFRKAPPNVEQFSLGLRAPNIDYKKFKLFQMSLLWRTSISSLEPFKNVVIPSHEKNRLREMLYNEDPGQSSDYSCLIVINRNHLDFTSGAIYCDSTPSDSGTIVRLMMAGAFWCFHVPEAGPTMMERKLYLTEDNVLPILFEEKYSTAMITEFMLSLAHNVVQ